MTKRKQRIPGYPEGPGFKAGAGDPNPGQVRCHICFHNVPVADFKKHRDSKCEKFYIEEKIVTRQD